MIIGRFSWRLFKSPRGRCSSGISVSTPISRRLEHSCSRATTRIDAISRKLDFDLSNRLNINAVLFRVICDRKKQVKVEGALRMAMVQFAKRRAKDSNRHVYLAELAVTVSYLCGILLALDFMIAPISGLCWSRTSSVASRDG